jgi:hypothetical protein
MQEATPYRHKLVFEPEGLVQGAFRRDRMNPQQLSLRQTHEQVNNGKHILVYSA